MKKLGNNVHFYHGQWRDRIVVPKDFCAIIGKTQLEEPLAKARR